MPGKFAGQNTFSDSEPSDFNMGLGSSRNSNSRTGRTGQSVPPSSPSAGVAAAARKEPIRKWTEDQILRLVEEKKLASRTALSTQSASLVDRETECPICFNDFEQLNAVICCNQLVCTQCYLTMRKPGEVNCICPFCDHAGFPVVPVDNAASLAHQASESESSPGGIATRARRKTFSTPVHVPVATKEDRESMEKEIRMSRSADAGQRPWRGGVASPPPARGSRGSPRSLGTATSPEEAIRELANMLQGSHLSEVNEMLLAAVIRQSMQQGNSTMGMSPPQAQGSVSAAAATPAPAPAAPAAALGIAPTFPPPPPYSAQNIGAQATTPLQSPLRDRLSSSAESALSEMSELTEEEQLQLAISLSLAPSAASEPSN